MIEKGKISQEPFIEILKTLEEAESANLVDWNAMNIASVDQMNQPSSRIVLLKKISDNYDAIIAIGCIIRGETDHYKFIAENSSFGIQKVSIEQEIPIIFGILTVENHSQAKSRISNAVSYAENAVEMACNF